MLRHPRAPSRSSRLGGDRRPGAGTTAIVIVIVAILVMAGVLVAILKITGPNGTSTSTSVLQPSSSTTSSASSSQSSSTSSSGNNFDPSADYRVEFTGSAFSSETEAPVGSCGYCYTADSNTWNWDFIFYYAGSDSQDFPVNIAMNVTQSTVSYQGSVTYEQPSTTCTFSSTSITGPGSMLMPITVYADGSATNSGGTSGYFPWGSVGGTSSPLNCGPPSNGWFDSIGGFLYIGYNHALANIDFQMTPGVYGGLGGSISGGTCPSSTSPVTISCIESPGTAFSDNWKGTITVTEISCGELPPSLQNCQS